VAEPIRVLWIIKGLGPGGAERLLLDTANHADRDRFDFRCCFILPWKDQLVASLQGAGVATLCIGGSRGAADPRWTLRLRRQSAGVDVVHTHSPLVGIGARSVLSDRSGLICTEHNTWDRYNPLVRGLNSLTFSRQRAAIAVSSEVARSFGKVRIPVEVIPNGVDVTALSSSALSRVEARAALGLGDEPVVGTVGGITRKKGYDVLVSAAAIVLQRLPEARFVWIGLPIDGREIGAAASAAGVTDRLVVAGYREDAARYMRAFDLFCLPSRHEGMPVALLEALALGVPAVAAEVGGVTEIAARGGVSLVRPEDPTGLADEITRLLSDSEGLGKLASIAPGAAAAFSIQETVRRTEAIYLRIASTRRPR
jgi:glycosyltransferase involved in cell wall biosynthesis